MSNTSSSPSGIDPLDWSYAESPDISEPVYIAATVYMVAIGAFGILSNSAVIIAFLRGSQQVGTLRNLDKNLAKPSLYIAKVSLTLV